MRSRIVVSLLVLWGRAQEPRLSSAILSGLPVDVLYCDPNDPLEDPADTIPIRNLSSSSSWNSSVNHTRGSTPPLNTNGWNLTSAPPVFANSSLPITSSNQSVTSGSMVSTSTNTGMMKSSSGAMVATAHGQVTGVTMGHLVTNTKKGTSETTHSETRLSVTRGLGRTSNGTERPGKNELVGGGGSTIVHIHFNSSYATTVHGSDPTPSSAPTSPVFPDSTPSSLFPLGNVTRPQNGKEDKAGQERTTGAGRASTATLGIDERELNEGGVGMTREVMMDTPMAAARSSTETVTVGTQGPMMEEERSWLRKRIDGMVILHGCGMPTGGLLVKAGFVGAAAAFVPQTIADQVGLMRGVSAFAYSLFFASHGDPTNLPALNQNEGHNKTRAYGIAPHWMATTTLMYNALENAEIAAVLSGVNRNQWRAEGWFWQQGRVFYSPLVLGLLSTVAIWWATVDLVEAPRSTLGSFKGGWGLGPAMATWHALIAVVSVGIWARAVWKFARNKKAQEDIERFVKGAEEKEGEAVKEVVRSRWLAGLYTVNMAANMIVAAIALDDQGRTIADFNFYLSIFGGCVAGLHLAITIDVVGRISKCCGDRRAAVEEPVEEVELEEVQTAP